MRLSASVAAVLIIAARILQPPPERVPEPPRQAPVTIGFAAAAEALGHKVPPNS